MIQQLIHEKVAVPDDIGIITPYYKQAMKIRELLKQRHLGFIKTGSVAEFQGTERKVIFISTVRATKKWLNHDATYGLGMLKDPRHLNTALTRVRCLLVVVGDPYILGYVPSAICRSNLHRLDSDWTNLMNVCKENGTYDGAEMSQEYKRIRDIGVG